MLPVPKKLGQEWYPAQNISKCLPRARRKTNRNANRRVRVFNGHAKYRSNTSVADWFEFKFECLKKDCSERKIRNHVENKVLLFLVNAIIEIQISIQNQSATLVFLRFFA